MARSYRGTTWGKAAFEETAFKLKHDNGTIIDVEYTSIKDVGLNKNQLFMEISNGKDYKENQDSLCELRFQTPRDNQSQSESEDEQQKQGKKEQDKGKDKGQDKGKDKEKKQDLGKFVVDSLLKKTKLNQQRDSSFITLDDVSLALPRGKYTLDFYENRIRFHGQSYNFTIQYKNIMKGFLLPMQNQSQVSIVLQLHKDKLIFHGSTSYRYIIFQLKKQIQVEVQSHGVESGGKVRPKYQGPLFKILIDIMKSVSQLTLIAPDLSDFQTKNKQSCVKCSIKAQIGWLYFLRKSLIYIMKPVFYFKTDDIERILMDRLNASSRQFDIQIYLKGENKSIDFIGIQKTQIQAVTNYFESRGVNLKLKELAQINRAEEEDDGEDEDDDFQGDAEEQSSSSEDFEEESGDKPKKKQ